MNITKNGRIVLKFNIQCRLATPLLLRSGKTGEDTDSTIEVTPDNQLHINGYVWASLIRRSLARINGYEELVKQIGKYQEKSGVSPLWCETTITHLPATVANPGISIDRKRRTVKSGALFNDELAIAGLPIGFNFSLFASTEEAATRWQTALVEALQIIQEGIENIGGGWGYGYGRLQVDKINTVRLDLTQPEQRKFLWEWDNPVYESHELDAGIPEKAKPVSVVNVSAQVSPGQLLVIKSSTFPLDAAHFGKLPDSFVFRRNRLSAGGLVNEPVLPGKALRQVLFSVPLERKWRSGGKEICAPSENESCGCQRCQWFGSTSAAGIIAVTDAAVNNPAYEVINRIQLCEHSMQNMNLFSGEYLIQGDFQFRIIIDGTRSENSAGLLEEIISLLDEMKGEKAPMGWYRVGGTTSCTGQIQVLDYTIFGRLQQ